MCNDTAFVSCITRVFKEVSMNANNLATVISLSGINYLFDGKVFLESSILEKYVWLTQSSIENRIPQAWKDSM